MGLVIQTSAGDSAPVEQLTLTRADGSVIDLTGASVTLTIQDPDTGLITNATTNQCTVTDPPHGVCTYSWNPLGTDCPDPGIYPAQLRIKYSDNTMETTELSIYAANPITAPQ